MRDDTLSFHTFRQPAPQDDEALASLLVGKLRPAVPVRRAGPSLIVVRGDRIDLLAVRDTPRLPVSSPREALALLTRARFADGMHPRAVGLIGVFGYRAQPKDTPVPTALLFLEWADCRWWQYRALVQPGEPEILPQTEGVLRAVDGDARPSGLGGWWSLGRRMNGGVSLTPLMPSAPGEALVH